MNIKIEEDFIFDDDGIENLPDEFFSAAQTKNQFQKFNHMPSTSNCIIISDDEDEKMDVDIIPEKPSSYLLDEKKDEIKPYLINKNIPRKSHFSFDRKENKNFFFFQNPDKMEISDLTNKESTSSVSKNFNPLNILENPSVFSKNITTSNLKRNSLENIEDLKPKKKKTFESYAQKSSIVRFKESAYDIMDVLQKKRSYHNNKSPKSENFTHKEFSDSKNSFTNQNLNLINKDMKNEIKERVSHDSLKNLETIKADENDDFSKKKSFLIDILNWNPCWFKKLNYGSKLPDLCSEPLQHLKLEYESVTEYVNTYKPLILNEIWAQICDKLDGFKTKEPPKIVLKINSYKEIDSFLLLYCSVIIKAEDIKNVFCPTEGDLLVVELNIFNQNKTSSHLVLGYISDSNSDEKSKTNTQNRIMKYTIKIRPMKVRIDVEKNLKCSSIFYLKPSLRQCDALLNFYKSPLHKGILRPKEYLFSYFLDLNYKFEKEFNKSQLITIENINRLIKKQNLSRILLIQGPPGTGKTYTLIGMIKKIFLEWTEDIYPKILICAPSNNAVDEIAKRIYKEKDFLIKSKAKRPLRIVRIGQEDSINANVKKSMYLETLVENNLKLNKNEESSQHSFELEEKEAELSRLAIEINRLECDKEFEKVKKYKSKLKQLENQIKSLQKIVLEKTKKPSVNIESLKRKLRVDLLSKADIILSTLNSCCNSSLINIFNEMKCFKCCIVDEASQCSEPEILLPLSYASINKLILIGDPRQLPATTISHKALEYKYGRSLFERFDQFIKNYNLKESIIMLNVQYRMHSEICSFPSKRFYDNNLLTNGSNDQRSFPLIPYYIFDIKDTIESTENIRNIHNLKECEFVLKLTQVSVEIINSCRRFESGLTKIGIITPYHGQRRLIEEKVKNFNSNKIYIEVNTIDGFQGKEMDVIIISAVRAFKDHSKPNSVGFLNSYQRLNVAITRAKCSLFICLNGDSLIKNSLWRDLLQDSKNRNFYKLMTSNIKPQDLENLIITYPK